MSINRYAKKPDSNQAEIVKALRDAGVLVWIISKPCDLLTLYRSRWLPLEVKRNAKRTDKRQEEQRKFLAVSGTPVVETAHMALQAVMGEL